MEFSIGKKPRSTSSDLTASITSANVGLGTDPPARSPWVESASSVKVPAGPRNATVGWRLMPSAAGEVAGGSMGGQDSGPHGRARSQTVGRGSALRHDYARRRHCQSQALAFHRSRLRQGGPPPSTPATVRRGCLRAREDRRTVWAHSGGAPHRARGRPRASHPARTPSRSQRA